MCECESEGDGGAARQKEELLGAPGPETQPCNFVPCSFCSGSKKMERDLN